MDTILLLGLVVYSLLAYRSTTTLSEYCYSLYSSETLVRWNSAVLAVFVVYGAISRCCICFCSYFCFELDVNESTKELRKMKNAEARRL